MSYTVKTDDKTFCVMNVKSQTHTPTGESLNFVEYDLVHRTHYEYENPVSYSTHRLRLKPLEDEAQQIEHSELEISQPAKHFFHEDVFGNQCVNVKIDKPYDSLEMICRTRVKIFARAPDDYGFQLRKSHIPLGWMPWQRQMMLPYLLPPELPESQLHILTDYAKSFLSRNQYCLIDTINDINQHIYRDYIYSQGETTIETTPFDVFHTRRGVCQDFANLFICLLRLLDVPARYRVGYIHIPSDHENHHQSAASHAWVEIYLPYIGWRGFDPTNGCVAGQEHIRLACGRNYYDATPTAGTLYNGGGGEKLTVEVKLTRC